MAVDMLPALGLPRPSLLFPNLTCACPARWHAAWGSAGQGRLGAGAKLPPWQFWREPSQCCHIPREGSSPSHSRPVP